LRSIVREHGRSNFVQYSQPPQHLASGNGVSRANDRAGFHEVAADGRGANVIEAAISAQLEPPSRLRNASFL
jgi:hypothetical protein